MVGTLPLHDAHLDDHDLDDRCRFDVVVDARTSVIHVVGELDVATRTGMLGACTATGGVSIVVDLTDLTFMDCAGYGSIVASRAAVEAGGGTLTVHGQTGQPARLLGMIAALERTEHYRTEP